MVSLAVVAIGVVVGLLAALAISRFAFRGRKIVIVGILAVQMIPLVAMIIPVFLLLNDLDQYDKLSGLIITYLTFILPFTVWTLRGFIVNIPKELEEAAMVDGCSRTGAFVRVVFPLLAPGMVATSVYGFIQAWNEYLYALMLLSQKNQTATVWLSNFSTKHGTEYAPMMAGATMMAVPIVALFLLVQRKMAAGSDRGRREGMTPPMTTIASGTDTLTRDALTVLQPGFPGTTAPDWLLRRLGEGLASVGLFGRNIASPEQLAALTAQLRAERDDVLVAIDEEGGDVTRLEVRTGSCFPGNHALGAVDDVSLTLEVAAELGRRLAACGVNLNWAPSADVNSNAAQPGHRRALLRRRPRTWSPGTPPPTSPACSRRAWPPAPSTSRATATRRSTPTTRSRASTPTRRC